MRAGTVWVVGFLFVAGAGIPGPVLAVQGLPATVVPSASPFRGFDPWVASIMAEWKVPGVAVAAIKNGAVVLAKGYGYRNAEKRLPVTSRTLMAIGSSSKSFTAMVLGILAEEKKLDWDQPVRDYLPDFQLHDEVATRLMTPRDLVDHRSGLPTHDALWYGRSFTRAELYQRLRFLEPSATFRQRWQYQNLMYMAAGVLAERITGQSWEELVRQRIFLPLGMTRSNFSVTDLARADDYSLPYAEVDSHIVAIPFRNLDAIGPAGSINSSVEEMIRYVQMNIDQGSYQGRTLISKATAIQMQSPQSASPVNVDGLHYPELGPGGYGLGLSVSSYRGRKQVSHGGGIDGFISAMSWLPHDKIGVVVLSNLSGNNPVPGLIERNVFDRLLGLSQVDWVARSREQQRTMEAQQEEMRQKQAAARVPGTSFTHPLAAYAGRYEHAAYGVVAIADQRGRLTLTLDGFTVPLEHFHYNVFKTAPQPGALPIGLAGEVRVTFSYGKDGKIHRLEISLEPAVSDIVFKRKT